MNDLPTTNHKLLRVQNQKAALPYSGPIDVISGIAGAAGSAVVFIIEYSNY